ncbi:MAG: hypothetical protein ABR909_00665 [Candidatus Bathyarchaeia archaeon]
MADISADSRPKLLFDIYRNNFIIFFECLAETFFTATEVYTKRFNHYSLPLMLFAVKELTELSHLFLVQIL